VISAMEAETLGSQLHKLRSSDAAMMPFWHILGFCVEHVIAGEAVVTMPCKAGLHNIFGYTHGRAVFALADTAIGLAHLAALDVDQTATTVESKINLLRPALSGELRAEAHVVKQRRTLSFLECDVTDEQGRLIALANATMMTSADEQSESRNNRAISSKKPHAPIWPSAEISAKFNHCETK
jgi:uncharacterized protein (TIGR00369 family)